MLSRSQISYIRSLQVKKNRQKFGQFLLEGDKIVREILPLARLQVLALFALPEWIQKHDRLLSQYPGLRIEDLGPGQLEQISTQGAPNQVLALAEIPEISGPPDPGTGLVLALETIQDPGNLGTILRIADWFGLKGGVCSPDCADLYHPRTIQSSMGSFARLEFCPAPLETFLEKYRDLPSFAATLQGEDYRIFGRQTRGILLIGNESRGLSRELTAYCRHRVRIPGLGEAESLNAAVAAGILCAGLCLPL